VQWRPRHLPRFISIGHYDVDDRAAQERICST
jgi:hypothetical protein